jgi:nitrate reductase gamma subunit
MWNVVWAQEPTAWDTLAGGSVECIVDGVPTLKCFEAVFSNIVFMASTLIVLALLVMFVVGAVSYMTSLGNPEKVKKAQNTLKYAIIGFVLFMGSFLILKTIDFLFLGNENKIFQFRIETNVVPDP